MDKTHKLTTYRGSILTTPRRMIDVHRGVMNLLPPSVVHFKGGQLIAVRVICQILFPELFPGVFPPLLLFIDIRKEGDKRLVTWVSDKAVPAGHVQKQLLKRRLIHPFHLFQTHS